MAVSSQPLGILASVDTGPAVSMDAIVVSNFKGSGSPCIANARIDNDGSQYDSDNVGNFGAAAQVWLDKGLNSEVWVSRVISVGSLDTDGIGSGRVVLSTDRIIGVQQAVSGTNVCSGTVTFHDASSGGNVLDTATFSLTADFA